MFSGIQNKDELATTELREQALYIIEAGYSAIDTEAAVRRAVSFSGDMLTVGENTFSLVDIDNVRIIGFGKASCEAVSALEGVLGDALTSGIAIDVDADEHSCELVDAYQGSHPTPTQKNVNASQKIVDLAEQVTERDLVIVVVSGGGSALLCWPESECEQGVALYERFLKAGGTIQELNTVRKHLSGLKGGGLAAMLYPARVVGLIFSDVPGGKLSDVASGPTFYDKSTRDDAAALLRKYDMESDFELSETPKDRNRFDRVMNVPLVTNDSALMAMADAARTKGYDARIISPRMYDFAAPTVERFISETPKHTVSLGGGEIRLIVEKSGGSGGRNLYLANEAMRHVGDERDLFIATASDGIDNCEVAGAIVDSETVRKAQELELDIETYLKNYDSQRLFEQTGDVIRTGSTGANVADLMIYMRA